MSKLSEEEKKEEEKIKEEEKNYDKTDHVLPLHDPTEKSIETIGISTDGSYFLVSSFKNCNNNFYIFDSNGTFIDIFKNKEICEVHSGQKDEFYIYFEDQDGKSETTPFNSHQFTFIFPSNQIY